MSPSTSILHLGTIIDSWDSSVTLSPERQDDIRESVLAVLEDPSPSLASLSSILGKFISAISITPWARLHARDLQWFLLPYQKLGQSTSSRRVHLPQHVRRSLNWWTAPNLAKGTYYKEQPSVIITTDASLSGWGAHCDNLTAQGVWTTTQSTCSINWLELHAVSLALKHFQHQVSGHHVLVLTDNMSAKAHINRQGGTKSRSLMTLAMKIGRWAERHLASLAAEHISGSENIQADWLSRAIVDQAEWQLDSNVFRQITTRFGRPAVDLFATPVNSQLPRFFSRYRTQGAEDINALRCPWPRDLLYAFPPLPILPQVINRIIRERAEVILIAPFWPRQPWFADLRILSVSDPWHLPVFPALLSQGPILHPDPGWCQLTAWRLSGAS